MDSILFLVLLGGSFLLTWALVSKMSRQTKKGIGCLSIGFIFVPVFLLVSCTPFLVLMDISTAKELYLLTTDDQYKSYTAVVQHYEDVYTDSERSGDGSQRIVTMGTPVVTFTTESGQELTRKLNFATEVNGESTYNLRYKEQTDEFIVTDTFIVVKTIALLLFSIIFFLAYWGVYTYLRGGDMKRYGRALVKGIMYFIFPIMTLSLWAGLVYGIVAKSAEMDLIMRIVLYLLTFLLTLGIIGIGINIIKGRQKKDDVRRVPRTTYRKFP